MSAAGGPGRVRSGARATARRRAQPSARPGARDPGNRPIAGTSIPLLLVPRDEIVDEAADAARSRADTCALLAARYCSDRRARSGASADDQRFLLPRPLVRVRRLRLLLDDGR